MNNASGEALIEVYDFTRGVASELANPSTRLVTTVGNIVIAGFMLAATAEMTLS